LRTNDPLCHWHISLFIDFHFEHKRGVRPRFAIGVVQ
jgi:hypothetical protein